MAILKLAAPLRSVGLVGTGGIGHGSFFQVQGNQTIGREESRSGRFLDRRDYCKLHIICHYVKALLGDAFPVFPIGRTGDDEPGRRLRSEMENAGLDMRFVRPVPGRPTLYSFCFLYPDGAGGNLTTEDSACGAVDPKAVAEAEPMLRHLGSRGIALAAPEVPLAARRALLELATRHGLFRAASFTREEMAAVRESGILGSVDLLAVNREEATAASGAPESGDSRLAVEHAAEGLIRSHPRLLLSITDGARGSWIWDGRSLSHEAARPVTVAGTSGAGDALFAGLLAGLAAGLPPRTGARLGALLAAASVTSADTIAFGVTRAMLRSLDSLDGPDAAPELSRMLEG